MPDLMKVVEQTQLRNDIPAFRVGCTVRVNYRISEGNKERIQAYEGVVIRKHLGDKNSKATFTVRKMTQGHGVERIFPIHSPRIESVQILKHGHVRRAKLYYLRERRGKAAHPRKDRCPQQVLILKEPFGVKAIIRCEVDEAGRGPSGTSGRGWCDSEPDTGSIRSR